MNLRLRFRERLAAAAAFAHCFLVWFVRAAGVSAGVCAGLFLGLRLMGFVVPKPRHPDIELLQAQVAEIQTTLEDLK